MLRFPALAAAFLPAAALAQPPSDGWSFSAGVAPVYAPIYSGADDYALSVFPDIRASYGDVFFASVVDGVGVNVFNTPTLKAGPIARIRFGRDEDGASSPFVISGDTDDLIGLGDVGVAGEVGGFAEARAGAFRLRGELRQGFGGHEGWVADAEAGYARDLGRWSAALGPRVSFGGRDFVQTYYGTTPAQALASGLPAFAAEGGLVSYGVGGSLSRPLGDRLFLVAFAGYDRLAGDAGSSPLVALRGDRDQASLGLAISYRFGK